MDECVGSSVKWLREGEAQMVTVVVNTLDQSVTSGDENLRCVVGGGYKEEMLSHCQQNVN